MLAALRLPLSANGQPASIGCERCLVRFLCVCVDDLEENGLLPKRRLATAILPLVSGRTWATQGGDDLGGGVVGKVGVETHGRRIHGKNKSAMRKIVLAQSPQCGQSDAVNQLHLPMKTEIRNFLKMLTDKAAENVAAGMSKEDAVNAVLNRLEAEHPALVAKLKEVLA